jgi:hypothetical protein
MDSRSCPPGTDPFVTGRTAIPYRRTTMKYALLIYDRPGTYDAMEAGELDAVMGEYLAISKDDAVVGGAQLQPVETATTIRVQDGETLTTDGPFAETKEVFGGYYVLEAEDLDAAIEIAGRIPAARLGGSVEVRPIVER